MLQKYFSSYNLKAVCFSNDMKKKGLDDYFRKAVWHNRIWKEKKIEIVGEVRSFADRCGAFLATDYIPKDLAKKEVKLLALEFSL